MKNKDCHIAFFGEDAFSNVVLLSLIEAGFTVDIVVTPLYENVIYKRLEGTCKRNGITFLRTPKINSEFVYERVSALSPDICITAHFERLIKQPLLSVPKLGFINLHPSLLPDYRGMAPQHWPLINGEKEAGITVHYIDEGTDTGNIIVQRRFALSDEMYVSDLQRLWLENYKTIMVEAVNRVLQGDCGIPQDCQVGRYYGKLKEEQCVLSKDMKVRDAFNLMRGVSLPYYGARMNGMIIYKAHIMKSNEHIDGKDVLQFSDGRLVIEQSKKII